MAAQEIGAWGSECDIRLTGDGKIIVNHDSTVDSLNIIENDFETIASRLLPNGERRPSLNEYLQQTAKGVNKTRLIIELKALPSQEAEDALVAGTIEALKAHKLWSPDKVAFISFSHHICLEIAAKAPEFINQYLEGDIAPDKLAEEGINGIDYEFHVFRQHPEWVAMAHELGMSVNTWTVDKSEDMDYVISLGVDAITTNEPLLLRGKLGERELKR
ncbi:MAG: glycerophosphodiester phosphodiesterase [Bacteroidales bacterium]|nr:glycerophosphodiester phosphodiesterase [Bacteroidales bacterium]